GLCNAGRSGIRTFLINLHRDRCGCSARAAAWPAPERRTRRWRRCGCRARRGSGRGSTQTGPRAPSPSTGVARLFARNAEAVAPAVELPTDLGPEFNDDYEIDIVTAHDHRPERHCRLHDRARRGRGPDPATGPRRRTRTSDATLIDR